MNSNDSLQSMFALLGQLPAPVRGSMVAMYSESLSGQLESLRQAMQAGDARQMQALAHKMAGGAAMMQDRELSQAARDMEAALQGGDADGAMRAMPRIRSHARATLAALMSA